MRNEYQVKRTYDQAVLYCTTDCIMAVEICKLYPSNAYVWAVGGAHIIFRNWTGETYDEPVARR